MFKITVSTTRSAMFCLAAACYASCAQADVGGIGGGAVAATVSDTLLASAHAANLQRSIVTSLGSTAPGAVVPVHATTSVANTVRLWDEVIPPAPSPKPTQAAAPAPTQPRTAVAVSQLPPTASTLATASIKVNVSATVTRMPAAAR
ncbi:hypothetical protein AB870_20330 [Pandoraea faecigallinarum]|uniref:ESPR domain-containing protein n=1 Tax=Pandoraea faecigallinarum TaxID=656179 RepID=A0A0H3WZ33_9BURK|nr:hypothetical protein [Pandoraea faecigallinarum]AKM31948.1 hypothetical protein AB870_20330 [Pandoraea faecigallinarum]